MVPQKRQDLDSWGMSLSPHVAHAHPAEVSIGRTAKHALHCKAKSALIKVQTGQVHCPSADGPAFGVFLARVDLEQPRGACRDAMSSESVVAVVRQVNHHIVYHTCFGSLGSFAQSK